MKFYMYISQPKVNMLFDQHAPTVSYKQKVDLKILSLERSSTDPSNNLAARTAAVEGALRAAGVVRESNEIRSTDPLPPYVHDVGNWRISIIKKAWDDRGPDPPWAYCLFRQLGSTAYFLLGSADNIMTQRGIPQRATAVSPSVTVDEYILDLLARSEEQPQDVDTRRVVGLLDYCARNCELFPEYNAEVLFKTYWRLGVNSHHRQQYQHTSPDCPAKTDIAKIRRVFVGSPIYAAMSDVW